MFSMVKCVEYGELIVYICPLINLFWGIRFKGGRRIRQLLKTIRIAESGDADGGTLGTKAVVAIKQIKNGEAGHPRAFLSIEIDGAGVVLIKGGFELIDFTSLRGLVDNFEIR